MQLDDAARAEAVAFGLAWRDLRRARWLTAFASLDAGQPLEASEIDTLDQIAWSEHGRMHEIADGLQVEASTATRAVDRLIRKGLAERGRDPVNGRYMRVWLTDEGDRVRAALIERRLTFVSEVLDRFEPGDRADLVRLLPELAAAIGDVLRVDREELSA